MHVILLHFTAEITQIYLNSSSSMPQLPPPMPPHTITPLPRRLTIRGPDDHFITVKVVPGADKTPEDADQWYTLPLSILDSSSDVPLSCAVALKGDQLAPGNGTTVCYLTLNVKTEWKLQGSTDPPTLPTHYIERRSKYTANGRATFRMCFYTETSYLISVGVHCVQDVEGVEHVEYNVAQYTAVIKAVRMVEIGTFKQLTRLKFEGPLASRQLQKLMAVYSDLFFKNKYSEAREMVKEIVCSGNGDIGLFMSIGDLITFRIHNVAQSEELLQKCKIVDSQNRLLLEAYAMMEVASSYSFSGDTEKALDCIQHSRSICFDAAPSYLTTTVCYAHARILAQHHEGNISPSVKKQVLHLLNHAIADSEDTVGWERHMIFQCHIKKAQFCLNGKIDVDFDLSSSYTPTADDISLAEKHLSAVPVDQLETWHAINYRIALCDLKRLKRDTDTARQQATMAKQVLDEKLRTQAINFGRYQELLVTNGIASRLQCLEEDPHDRISAKYSKISERYSSQSS